jgi:class 3 adenylate cyclase
MSQLARTASSFLSATGDEWWCRGSSCGGALAFASTAITSRLCLMVSRVKVLRMRCPNCSAENAATRRFCAQCGAPLPSPCPTCGFENELTAKFCGGCGKPIGEVTASAPSNLPAPPRNNGAERRQLTVMFCDLVDSTALSSRLDPEDMREVIRTYHNAVAEIVENFGGFVARYMGDGALIYFGYPFAQEDDAERALRAGLALISRIDTIKLASAKLRSRIGVATGLVIVGDLTGGGHSNERDVIGETPNLAARLQNLAEPNTVLIAESTRQLVRDFFEYRGRGPMNVRGFDKAVQVWEVLRPSAVESRFQALRAATLTPLVGREEETELLFRRWARAKQGNGQTVLLSGEAGIGKSRMTAALQERLSGEQYTRLTYFCSPRHRDSPLHPFISQLERAAGFARDDAPPVKLDKLEAWLSQSGEKATEVAALFADLMELPDCRRYSPFPSDAQRRRELTLTAFARQLDGLAHQGPVLVVFEDAQWIDFTSLELLEMAIERIPGLPVLLLLTFRPEFQTPWAGQAHVTMLVLRRLNQRDTAELAERVARGRALPRDLPDQIVERADGIPLFTRTLGASRPVLQTVLEAR